MADGTKSYPIGIVKDIEVHIGKLKLLNDFYVIDMKKDPKTPLLVGRRFLAIANAGIDIGYEVEINSAVHIYINIAGIHCWYCCLIINTANVSVSTAVLKSLGALDLGLQVEFHRITGSNQGFSDESTVVSATSNEGTGIKPGVLDEEKDIIEEKVILEWGDEQDSEHSDDATADCEGLIKMVIDADDEGYKIRVCKDKDEEMINVEVDDSDKGDKEVTDAAKADAEKTSEAKDDPKKIQTRLLEVKIQSEVQHTQSLSVLSVPVSVISKPTVPIPVQESPSTAIATTLPPPFVSTTPSVPQPTTTLIPTPTITNRCFQNGSPLLTVPESNALNAVELRVSKLEKDVFELKTVDRSTEALAILKSQVPFIVDNYLGSKVGDVFQKELKKHTADLILKYSLQQFPESSNKQTPTINLEQGSEKSDSEILQIKREQAEKQQKPKFTIKSTDKVMAARVISISFNTSEESVGSHAPLVILFGVIPAIIPTIPEVPIVLADPVVAPEEETVSVVSPARVLDLVDYSLSFDSDLSEDSLPPAPDLPLVSPFLCFDNTKADGESEPAEQRPVSSSHDTLAPLSEFPLAPVVAPPGTRRRPTIIVRPGEAIPFGRPYRTHLNGPRKFLTKRQRVIPIPARRLARRRVSHHSPDRHSSPDSSSSSAPSDHSLSGHTPPDATDADSSTPQRFSSLGSSSKRLLDSSPPSSRKSRKRCRSPTASVPLPTHVSSGEEHMEVDTADAEAVADVGISKGVVAHPEDGVGMGFEIAASDVKEDDEEFEAETSATDMREIVVDPLAIGDSSESSRGEASQMVASGEQASLVERIGSLRLEYLKEEFRQVRRDRDDTWRRLGRLESYVERHLGFRP
ncbi:hypothetical protein Tco_0926968 [Tanacetum coccineum]|uniref:Uncharacterized protein n=1 Tax=Tanacetum coccineum TaxID=301880 RepID=A0ABQ5DIA0_9ASTR